MHECYTEAVRLEGEPSQVQKIGYENSLSSFGGCGYHWVDDRNLVYSTALRATGNPRHAEEITQAVIVILARKAGTFSPDVVVSGWLYQTARLTTATVTTTKTIAMTTLQKTVITATLAVAVGTGIYEARQASRLRDQNQTLQQQHATLVEQNSQSLRERADVTSRLTKSLE